MIFLLTTVLLKKVKIPEEMLKKSGIKIEESSILCILYFGVLLRKTNICHFCYIKENANSMFKTDFVNHLFRALIQIIRKAKFSEKVESSIQPEISIKCILSYTRFMPDLPRKPSIPARK